MSGISGFMIVCLALLPVLTAYASANPALVSSPTDRACWSTGEDGEIIYSAPLVIDCLPDNPKCGV
ncbi:unnamed protein product [Aureobasidium mustum]|uniref:Uncharacterized protein n=1 Tax=Aureobasidium mustum TaxID=2773714 RepID=A0A9N8PLD5_9PEZI|nr:unnamed protein product [Aureobasidium mustum]